MTFLKNRNNKLLIYLIAFLMIINNGTVYTHIVGYSFLDAITTYAPIILFFILFLINRRLTKKSVLIGISIAVYCFIYMILSNSNTKVAVMQIILLFVYIVYFFSFEQREGKMYLWIAYRDIIVFIASISILIWIFGSLLGIIQANSTILSNWGTSGTGSLVALKNYFGIYFERDETYILGRFIVCNRAIFVERAFAAFSFSIACIYELFVEENVSKKRLVILVAAMISTLSMTGLIVTVITLIMYYVFYKKNSPVYQLIKFMIVPMVLVVGLVIISYLLQTKMSMGHSFSSRTSDFINGINAWTNSVLWGYGFGNDSFIHSNFHTGYSNSISMVLTQGGIMLGILYLVCLLRGIMHGIKKKNINWILCIIVFFIEFSFTAVAFRNITMYMLIVFGFSVCKQPIKYRYII